MPIEQARGAALFGYQVKPVKEDMLGPALEHAAARFQEWDTLRAEVANLQESLETRDLVDEAKRKLIDKVGLTERLAFLRIHHRSRERRLPTKQVAEEILKRYE